MKLILHFVTDYPGSLSRTSTMAVKNLLSKTSDKFRHVVVMVDRKNKFSCVRVGEDLYSLVIPRLKFGIFNSLFSLLSFFLLIFKYNELRNADLVHCHKLTIEGCFGFYFNLFLGKPYLISIRGSTDSKWYKYKFYSRWFFNKILKRARHVFFVSAWMKEFLQNVVDISCPKKSSLLPNICDCSFDSCTSLSAREYSNRIIFVGRLNLWRYKGLDQLITALSKLNHLHLDIYGQSEDKYIQEVRNFSSELECTDRVQIKGYVDNKLLRKLYSNYFCLVMLSDSDTFGMNYVEALDGMLPVIIQRGSGIDGYISNKPYLVSVVRNDVVGLINVLNSMYSSQKEIKDELVNDYSCSLSNLFSDCSIRQRYINVIESI